MVDWEVTATTIYCDDVDDEVTIIVSGNGNVKCTGAQKYAPSKKESTKELKKKRQKKGKILLCKEASCTKLTEYRDALLKKK